MLILIGSAALYHHTKGMSRHPLDIDIIGSYDEVINIYGKQPVMYPIDKGKKFVLKNPKQRLIVEAELTWENSTATQLQNLVLKDIRTIFTSHGLVPVAIPALNTLYLLKMSHRYLRNSPHFLKTMRDIQLMRVLGASMSDLDTFPGYREWYKAREKETYWYKHPKLSVGKDDFFKDDGIVYQYDHDSIHRSIMHLDKPAYEYYQVDNEEVLCSKDKFYSISEEIRLYGVLEEIYVLALERHQIPNLFKPPARISINIAAMKVCTSITSGWFRSYAYENYDKVLTLANDNYVERFKLALTNGNVPPFKKKSY